jgi:hypothetical protein
MTDQMFNDVHGSYDRVAEEYVLRISEELKHKSLDRQLLDRFAAQTQGLGPVCDLGCGPADVHKWTAVETNQVSPVDARFGLIMRRVVIALALALVVLLVFLSSPSL